METCSGFCELFSHINWLWYAISIVVVFGVGAVWFSVLFGKTWMEIFNVEVSKDGQPTGALFTMIMQFIVTALMGLAFFVLTSISAWLAVLVLIAFCGWQKGNLKFRYINWRRYFLAALIEAGYTFVAGIIFILFALL